MGNDIHMIAGKKNHKKPMRASEVCFKKPEPSPIE
jgi:hypothetical protein